jgi:hypothetical protein
MPDDAHEHPLVIPGESQVLGVLRAAHSPHWPELPFEEFVIRALRTGAKVLLASKRPRKRNRELGDLIERTYTELKKKGREPTAQDVLDELPRYDKVGIVNDVFEDAVYWTDTRGRDHSMRLTTLRNRLSRLRARSGSAQVHE